MFSATFFVSHLIVMPITIVNKIVVNLITLHSTRVITIGESAEVAISQLLISHVMGPHISEGEVVVSRERMWRTLLQTIKYMGGSIKAPLLADGKGQVKVSK